MNGQKSEIHLLPFRGDYYVLRPEKHHKVRALIYPVPDPRFPFLGVHFTRRINGEVWAGPNAVMAFARRLSALENQPKGLAGDFEFQRILKLAAQYWKIGIAEMYRDYVKAAYVKELQRYIPDLQSDDIMPGPSGVRAQALAKDGRLLDDFVIHHGRTSYMSSMPLPRQQLPH